MAAVVTPGGVAQALNAGDTTAVILTARLSLPCASPQLTPPQLLAVVELNATKQRLHLTLGDGEAEVKAVVMGAAFAALNEATPGSLLRLRAFGATVVPDQEQKCARGRLPAGGALGPRPLLCANGREQTSARPLAPRLRR